jgi:hypothetical protein
VGLLRITPSTEPQLFAWNDFWVRVAANPYSTEHLDDVRTHLTAMHLLGEDLAQLPVPNPTPQEFEQAMREDHPALDWAGKLGEIHSIMTDTMCAAFARCPQMLERTNAYAIYGFDFMVDEQYQPILLEVQYDPACKDGFLARDALGCLLLGEEDSPNITRLCG